MSIFTDDPPYQPFEEVAERYEQSADFTADALEWASEHAERHPKLVELARDYYRESPQFATKVQDALDGEVAFS
jgi:hypothetical protein